MENKLNKKKRKYFAKTKEAYWFYHDSNAARDEKILKIRVKYGWEGYGIYWVLIEQLRNSKQYKIKKDLIDGLAFDLQIELEKLTEFIDYCTNVGLLKSNDNFIWSQSLQNRMKRLDTYKQKQSENGSHGADERWRKDKQPKEDNKKRSAVKNTVDPTEEKYQTLLSEND